jgi:ribosomal protein L4
VAFLDALELTGRNVLVILADRDDAIGKSFRNVPAVHLLTVDRLNVHDVLVSDIVVFAEAALDRIGRPGRNASAAVEDTTEEGAA